MKYIRTTDRQVRFRQVWCWCKRASAWSSLFSTRTVVEEPWLSEGIVQSHKKILAITTVSDIESPNNMRACENPQANSRIHL